MRMLVKLFRVNLNKTHRLQTNDNKEQEILWRLNVESLKSTVVFDNSRYGLRM